MPASKGGYFVPVAADGHGAPAAAVCARSVVEEKAALRISAKAKPRVRAFRDDFCRRAGHGGKQPFQAVFPGHKLDFPIAIGRNKFVVPFGNAQDFVNRINPFAGYFLPVQKRIACQAQG